MFQINRQYEIYKTLSSTIFLVIICALLINLFVYFYFILKKNKLQGPISYQQVVKKLVKKELMLDVKVVQENRWFTEGKFKKAGSLGDEEIENRRLGFKTHLNPYLFLSTKKLLIKMTTLILLMQSLPLFVVFELLKVPNTKNSFLIIIFLLQSLYCYFVQLQLI